MKVEKNIPIPQVHSKINAKYPFADLDVGDSFFVSGQTSEGPACSSARRHGRVTGKKFCCKTDETGVRIWRIA